MNDYQMNRIPFSVEPEKSHWLQYLLGFTIICIILVCIYYLYTRDETEQEVQEIAISDEVSIGAQVRDIEKIDTIKKNEWGISFTVDPVWIASKDTTKELILLRDVVDGGARDELSITYNYGSLVSTEDSKFGTTTFRYDEEVGTWMKGGKYKEIEDIQEPEWVEADIQETDNGIRYATSTGRWLTYVVFIDDDETLVLNISGGGETEPLKDFLNSIVSIEKDVMNWDQYMNSEYGYAHDYPTDWDFIEGTGGDYISLVINSERSGVPDTDVPIEQLVIRMDEDMCSGQEKTFSGKVGYDTGWEEGFGLIQYRTLCFEDGDSYLTISASAGDDASMKIMDTMITSLSFF